MPSSPQSRTNSVQGRTSEAGYILIAVLFLVALILLSLAVAAPKIAQSIQRDKELELIHRGEQYKRAVKLYYKKFGAYPSSIDQLVNTNQIRFLRKRYTDPMTGKDDWKIIHLGQAHIKPVGLFGQPISTAGNSTTAGGSAFGGIGQGGIAGGGPGSLGTGGLGTIGAGSGSTASPTPSGTDGSSSSAGSPTDGSTTGSTSGFGSSGSGSGGPGSGGLGSGAGGNTNPTFGGAPIEGFAIPSTKASIKEYKRQKHYNEWEFVYDPLEEQLQAGTLFGGAAQNLNGTGTTNGAGNGLSGTGTGGITTPGSGIGTGGITSPGSGTGNAPTPQQ